MRQLIYIIFCILAILTACSDNTAPPPEADYTLYNNYLEVDGIPVHYAMDIPSNYSPQAAAKPLIVGLHYAGTTTKSAGRTFMDNLIHPAFESMDAIMVAPVSPVAGSWSNATCRKILTALVDSLQNTYNIDSEKIAFCGYSMGAEGVWTMVSYYPHLISAAIPVSGIPPQTLPAEAVNIPIYVLNSIHDEVIDYSVVDSAVSNLQNLGFNVELHSTEELTHYETDRFVVPLAHSTIWLKELWGISD